MAPISRNTQVSPQLTFERGQPTFAARDTSPETPVMTNEIDFIPGNDDCSKDWVRRNLTLKTCARFVRTDSNTESADLVCCCGREMSDHKNSVRLAALNDAKLNARNWKLELDTISGPTNAFGEMSLARIEGFVGHAKKRSKYVRLSDDTSDDVIMDLLIKKWKLQEPNLILNLLGGQKHDSDSNINDVFVKGIFDASLQKKTKAWIVTDGVYTGIFDKAWMSMSRVRPVMIGLVQWGRVAARHKLVNNEGHGKWPAKYKMNVNPQEKEVVVDLNLSHLLMVDDGTIGQDSVTKFRYRFMDLVKRNYPSTPVVNVLFNGGLMDVQRSRYDVRPTVVVKDSGGAADIVALAYELGPDHQQTRELIKTTKPNDILDLWVDELCQLLENRDLLTIYDCKNRQKKSSLDAVILRAPILHTNMSMYDRLLLALIWDRLDLAQNLSLESLSSEDYEKLMLECLRRDRPGFVELLLLEDRDMSLIVTPNTLEDLYNKAEDHGMIKRLLNRTKYKHRSVDFIMEVFRKLVPKDADERRFNLTDVGRVIRRKIGYFYYPIYLQKIKRKVCLLFYGNQKVKQKKKFEEPARELFIWAVLNDKNSIADFIWTLQKNPMAAALTASNLLRAMARSCRDVDTRLKYKDRAKYFQTAALGVLQECAETDNQPDWNKGSSTSVTEYLLIRKQTQFGKATCLQLAFEGKCRDFVGHRSVQLMLDKIWRGKVSLDNAWWRIVLSIIFPPFLYAFLYFQEDANWARKKKRKKEKEETKEMEETRLYEAQRKQFVASERGNMDMLDLGRKLTYIERARYFISSPMIVFSYNCISYLCFLLLFSYVMLSDYRKPPIGPTVPEIVLASWAGTLYLEEFRQMFKQRWSYFKYASNLFDISALLLFVAGFILRSFAESFETSRYIMCLSLIVFYLRLLHIFSVFKQLGPLLIMIKKMVLDLIYFMFFVAVFFIAYGIVWTSILYPNSDFTGMLVFSVLRAAYWPMHGEVQTYLQGDLELGTCQMVNGTLSGCSNAQIVAPPLLAIYILFINVLMFNLLIALFSHRFDTLHEENDLIWSYQRYSLIREYIDRPPLPPPFIILCHVPQILFFALRRVIMCFTKKGEEGRCARILQYRWPWDRHVQISFNGDEKFKEQDLSTFECLCAEAYTNRRKDEPSPPKERGLKGDVELIRAEIRGDEKYDGLRKKIDMLAEKLDNLNDNDNYITSRL